MGGCETTGTEWVWGFWACPKRPKNPHIFFEPLFIFFPLNIIFIPLFPFPLFSIFETLNYIFLSLFVFPLSYTKISKNNNNNIRQRPTTLFASAYGIFLTLAYARLRITVVAPL